MNIKKIFLATLAAFSISPQADASGVPCGNLTFYQHNSEYFTPTAVCLNATAQCVSCIETIFTRQEPCPLLPTIEFPISPYRIAAIASLGICSLLTSPWIPNPKHSKTVLASAFFLAGIGLFIAESFYIKSYVPSLPIPSESAIEGYLLSQPHNSDFLFLQSSAFLYTAENFLTLLLTTGIIMPFIAPTLSGIIGCASGYSQKQWHDMVGQIIPIIPISLLLFLGGLLSARKGPNINCWQFS